MAKFICRECRTPCEMNYSDMRPDPGHCPSDGMADAKWKRVKEEEKEIKVNKQKTKKYWMVHNPKKYDPHKRYFDKEEAIKDAMDIASKEFNQSVYLLEATSVYRADKAPVTAEVLDD